MTTLRSTTFQLHVKNEDGTTKMRTFTRAVSDAKETTETLNATLGDNVDVTYKTVQSSRELTQQARMQVTQMERANRAYRDQVAQLNHQIGLVGKSEQEQAALNAVMRLGANATEQQKKEVYELTMAYHNLNQSTNGATGSMRNMRGVAQNFGWQLQDTVVQLQMGTDAFIVLSQQGSQMASAFGAAGAVVGAAIAIFGAVTPAIIAALTDTEASTEEYDMAQKALNETLKSSKFTVGEYTDELLELHRVDSSLAELKLATALYDSQTSIKFTEQELKKMLNTYLGTAKAIGGTSIFLNFDEARKELGITTDEFAKLRQEFLNFQETGDSEGVKNALVGLTDTGRTLTPELNTLIREFVDLDIKSDLARQQLEKIQKAMTDGLKPATSETRDAVTELTEAYAMKTIALGQTDREQAVYSELLGLSSDATDKERDAVVKSINTYYDRKEAIASQVESEKERIRLSKEAEKQAEAEAKASQKAIMQGISLSIKAEQQRVKSRDALLKPIERDVTKTNYTEQEQEFQQHTHNMNVLNQQLASTLDFEFSERERINLLIEQEQQRHKAAMGEISTAQLMAEMNNAATFLSEMNKITGQLAGLAEEGSKEAELLFYANQAIAFANAIVNTEQAATRALVDGGTFAGMSLASVIRATGYASAGIIAGTTLAGAFDKGGYIPSNQMGIVSEYGDELVNGVLVKGPARVTSREDTAKAMNAGNGATGGSIIIQQTIQVSGSGDKALNAAMRVAAEQGAKQGAEKAYALVSSDFNTGRGIRATLKKSIGV
ncbi:coil containing protein [Vibrio phage 1.072.O._10N.286.48.A12]|nr:coil containing protein [Vibrio phage 1.072.O._10N.286.48.A12]